MKMKVQIKLTLNKKDFIGDKLETSEDVESFIKSYIKEMTLQVIRNSDRNGFPLTLKEILVE